jgi:hypothetical protein
MLATAPSTVDTPNVNSINVDELLESASRSIQVCCHNILICRKCFGKILMNHF